MSRRARNTAPTPQLIYTRDVETVIGSREIELYWGNFAELVNGESCVVISSAVYNERLPEKPIVGKAWDSLKARYPILNSSFNTVILGQTDSAIWKARQGEHAFPVNNPGPRISVSAPHEHDEELPRAVFCLHTVPMRGASKDEYDAALAAVLAAIRAHESQQILSGAMNSNYGDIVLSTLAGQQADQPHELLRDLMAGLAKWLQISPTIRTIKVCYWEPDRGELDAELIRKQLLELIHETPITTAELQTESTRHLILEFRQQLDEFARSVASSNEELRTASENLNTILSRTDPTIMEIGAAGGRLAEALVNHLHFEFFNKRPGTFFSGIENLAEKRPTTEQFRDISISSWYKSYLHTLRTLRNTTAHSQSYEATQFPKELDAGDTWILIVNLKRVLNFHQRLVAMKTE